MHFHHREGLETTATLGIPDVAVVVSGEAMVAHGLRPANPDGDFDIVTTLPGNLYLEEQLGFRAVRQVIGFDKAGNQRTITARVGGPGGKVESHRWAFSAARYEITGKGRMYIDELLELSDRDDETGLYVLNKAGLLLQKTNTGRSKDEKDVRRIHQHDEWGY